MLRRSRLALGGALILVVALVLVYIGAIHVDVLRRLDVSALNGFTGLDRPRVEPIARFLATLCDPQPFVWLIAALVAVALLRRRPQLALGVIVAVGAASVTTQLLKPALAAPRGSSLLDGSVQMLPGSWPSGHATAAMSLALCAILVSPARLRPWVAALGAAFAVAVTFSFLLLGWHYPSDVLGGFLVAALWTLLVVGVVWWAQDREPRAATSVASPPLRQALAPAGITALCALLVALVVLLARPAQVVTYAQSHTAFVIGAGALAAAALVLAAGVSLLALPAARR